MSESIENRIVEMQFDNKDFEKNAQQTLDTLDELKKSLNFDAASKNLQNFGKAASNIDLTGLQSSVEKIKDRFSSAGIASMEVIKRVTNFAIDAGIKVAQVLAKPMNVIANGGWERAMNIENAKFQLEGLGVTWNSIKDDINYGVESTAYGLDAAAKAAAQLVASGVKVGDSMKGALRGISGVAAMTNSSYEEISPIFTTVAGQGKLMTMQMRQLESRGLNVAASMAKVFTEINKGAIDVDETVAKSVKSFTKGADVSEAAVRELVTKGKIGFAEFSTAMDEAFGAHAKDANKTFSGALSNVQAALKKIGAEFATPFINNAIPVLNEVRLLINAIKANMPGLFDFASKIMSLLSATVVNNLAKAVDFLNNKFTGLANINRGLHNILTAFTRILAAVKTAFVEVFKPAGQLGDAVNNAAVGFEKFTEKLIPTDNALIVIKNVLVAVFSALKKIGSVIKVVLSSVGKVVQIVSSIVIAITKLLATLVALGVSLAKNSKLYQEIQKHGGLVSFTIDKIKNAFAKLNQILKDNDTIFAKVINTIKNVGTVILGVVGGTLFNAINEIKNIFSDLMSGKFNLFDYLKTKVQGFISIVKDALNYLKQFPVIGKAITGIENVFSNIKGVFDQVSDAFSGFFDGLKFNGSIIDFFKSIIDRLKDSFKNLFDNVKSGTGVFGKIKDFIVGLKEMPVISKAIDNVRFIIDKIKVAISGLIDLVKRLFSSLSQGSSGGGSAFRPLMIDLSFTEKAAQGLLTVLKAIGMVLGGAIMTIIGVFNTAVSVIKSFELDRVFSGLKEFASRVKDLHLLQTAIDAFKSSGGNLVEVLKALIGKFGSLFAIVKDAGVGVFDFFAEKIRNVIKAIADFFSGFSASTDKMSGASSRFQTAIHGIKSKFGEFGTFASQKLSELVKSGFLTKTLMVAYCLAILKALIQIPSAISKISKSISGSNGLIGSVTGLAKNASSFMDVLKGNLLEGRTLLGSLKTAVEQWGKAQKNSGLEAIPEIIRNIAISIAILAVSMAALAAVPTERLIPAATALGIFVGVMIAFATVLAIVSKNPIDDFIFKSFAANMLAMAIATAIVAASIATIVLVSKKLDTKGAIIAIVAIAGIMTAMFFVMKGMSKLDLTGSTLRSAILLVAFAASIAIVASTFNKLAKNLDGKSIESIAPAIVALISIVAAFGVVTVLASRIRPGSIITLVGMALLFGYVFKTLSSVFTESTLQLLGQGLSSFKNQLAAIIISIVAIMALMEVAIAIINALILKTVAQMGKSITLAGLAFLEVGVGLAFMANAFVKLSELDLFANGATKFKNLATSIVIIGGIFTGLMFLANAIKTTNVDKTLIMIAGSMALLGSALLSVVIAGKVAEYVQWNGILKALAVLTAMAGMLAGLAVAVQRGGSQLKFGAIMGMVIGMVALVGMLMVLGVMCSNQETFYNLLKALGLIAGIMLSMAAVLAAAGQIKTGQSWKPLLVTLVMLGTVFAGLFVLSKNVQGWEDLVGLGIMAGIVVGVIAALMGLLRGFLGFAKENNLGQSKAVYKSMTAFAVMIGALAVVTGVLVVLDKFVGFSGGLVAKVALATTMLGALTGLSLLIVKMSSSMSGNTANLIKMGITMAALIVAMLAIAGVLAVLDNLSLDNGLAEKTGLLMAVFLELSALTIIFGRFGKADANTFKAMAVLTIMMALFGVLSLVLRLLNTLPLDGMLAKSQILMLVMAELAAIQIIVSKFGSSLSGLVGVAGFAVMAALFSVLAIVFHLIAALPLEGILPKSQIIMLVMVELAAILVLMGVLGSYMAIALVGVVGLTVMVALFGVLTLIVGLLSSMPLKGMLPKTQILMLVLLELAAIMVVLGIPAIAMFALLGGVATIALSLMVVVFGILALICRLIVSGIPLEGLLPKTQIIVLVLFELAAIMVLLGIPIVTAFALLGGIATVALSLMVVVFGILALLCKIIVSEIPLEGLLPKTQILVLTLFELVAIMEIMGLLCPLAVLALAGLPSLLAMILGIVAITGALILLKDQNPQQMRETVDVLVEALYKIIAVIKDFGDSGVGSLLMASIGITAIGVSCMIAAAGVNAMAQAVIALAISLATISPQITIFFNSIATGIINVCNSIVAIISQTGMVIVSTVTLVITGVITAIIGGVAMILGAGQLLGSGLVDGFKTAAMEILKAPADIVQALVAGIAGVSASIWNAGKEMGSKLVEGFRAATGWHSPPEFLVKFFKDSGVAVNENASGVTDLFEGTGLTWGTALTTALGNKFENFDLKSVGLGFISDLTSGLKSGEGGLFAEISKIGNMLGLIANAGNLAARGFSTSQSDYIYELEGKLKNTKKLQSQYKSLGEGGTKASNSMFLSYQKEAEKYSEQLDVLYKQTGLARNATDDFSVSLDGLTDSFGGAGGAAGGAASSMEDFESKLTGVLEGQMDIFSKFEKKSAMSKEELLSNMRSQIQGMAEWANDMNALAAKGIDQGLYEKLAMMGPQGAEYVGAFAQMTAEELAEANKLWGQSLVLPSTVAKSVTASFNSIGTNVVQGFANGMDPTVPVEKAQYVAGEVVNATEQRLEIQSPSKIFEAIGKYLMDGLKNGITKNSTGPFIAMRNVCNELIRIAKENLKEETFYTIGVGLINGLTAGLKDEDAVSALSARLHELAELVAASKGKDFKENSPSKITEDIGVGLVEGLAKGLGEKHDLVRDEMGGLATETIDTMRSTIASIAQTLLEDDEFTPVITPVLDLTNVTTGARQLNSLFTTNQALSAMMSMENLQNQQLNDPNNPNSRFGTTFIQNNYSPKALNRMEIYRQTRNQFAQYKEAMQ